MRASGLLPDVQVDDALERLHWVHYHVEVELVAWGLQFGLHWDHLEAPGQQLFELLGDAF